MKCLWGVIVSLHVLVHVIKGVQVVVRGLVWGTVQEDVLGGARDVVAEVVVENVKGVVVILVTEHVKPPACIFVSAPVWTDVRIIQIKIERCSFVKCRLCGSMV